MVFIGDFVPNIIALIFPEDWAQDMTGLPDDPSKLYAVLAAGCCTEQPHTLGPSRTFSILVAAVPARSWDSLAAACLLESCLHCRLH